MKSIFKNIATELGYLNEQESSDRDKSKDTTSGEFNVDVPVQNEMEKVNIKYGHVTGPVDDVTISWGDESHTVDFEAEDVIDDHGNEGNDMTFVAYSQDDKWRFIVDVSVGFNYENSGEIQDVDWDTLEIDVDDSKVDSVKYDDDIVEESIIKNTIKKVVKEIKIKEQRINTHYKGNCCEWCTDLAAGRAIGNYPPEGCEDWNCNDCLREEKQPLNEAKIQCGCDYPCDAQYGCYYIEECSPDCDNCSSSCSDPFPLNSQGMMTQVDPPIGGGLSADNPRDTKFSDYEDRSDKEMKAMNVTGLGKRQCETCSDCPDQGGSSPCDYFICTKAGNCVDRYMGGMKLNASKDAHNMFKSPKQASKALKEMLKRRAGIKK